eukprot:Gb_07064 [translate_table: standard]
MRWLDSQDYLSKSKDFDLQVLTRSQRHPASLALEHRPKCPTMHQCKFFYLLGRTPSPKSIPLLPHPIHLYSFPSICKAHPCDSRISILLSKACSWHFPIPGGAHHAGSSQSPSKQVAGLYTQLAPASQDFHLLYSELMSAQMPRNRKGTEHQPHPAMVIGKVE